MFHKLIAALLLVVLGVTPAAAQSSGDSISMGYSNIAGGELPVWVAAEEGFFSRHGLTVNSQLISGGANTVAALVSGQIQRSEEHTSELQSHSFISYAV